jgi:nucleoside-diphosphate-sugar epimerase
VTRAPRAVVTGATGYVGRVLVPRLLDDGWRVRALVQTGTEDEVPRPDRVEQVRGDLLDREAVEECVAGADVVFHLAGQVPRRSRPEHETTNVEGTRVVTRSAVAHGVQRVVLMSTVAVYARAPALDWPTDEEAPLRRRLQWRGVRSGAGLARSFEDYAASKQRAEQVVELAHGRHGLDGVVVRSTQVYGPWQQWFSSFLDRARTRPEVLRRSSSRLPALQWLHADDLGDLLLRAGGHERHGMLVVNAAGPEMFSELDLARLATTGAPPSHRSRAAVLRYSTERARRRLGWAPRVHLAEGVGEMVAQDRGRR